MSGLSCKHTQMMAKVTLKSVHDKPGIAAEVFSALGEQGIMAELLSTIDTGHHRGDISFAVPQDQLDRVRQQLDGIKQVVGFKSIDSDSGVSVINICGEELTSDPAATSKILKALAGAGVNLQMINQSLHYLSFMVNRAQLQQALAVLSGPLGIEV